MGLACLQKLNLILQWVSLVPLNVVWNLGFLVFPQHLYMRPKDFTCAQQKEELFTLYNNKLILCFKTCVFSSDSLNQIFSSLTLLPCTGGPVGSTKSSSTLSAPVDALDLLGLVPAFTHVAVYRQSLPGGDRVSWSEGSQGVCGTWCVWTLLPVLYAEHWIVMQILPQWGFMRTPSLLAAGWTIIMCRIQCWDLRQGATPADMAKSNSWLLWRVH